MRKNEECLSAAEGHLRQFRLHIGTVLDALFVITVKTTFGEFDCVGEETVFARATGFVLRTKDSGALDFQLAPLPRLGLRVKVPVQGLPVLRKHEGLIHITGLRHHRDDEWDLLGTCVDGRQQLEELYCRQYKKMFSVDIISAMKPE